MASRSLKNRRLRWALLIALVLHLVLLWRYAPGLFTTAQSERASDAAVQQPEERVVEIATPIPPPPKARGMVLATRLGASSPESAQQTLPEGFFDKPKNPAGGSLHLAAGLDFSRTSGVQIVASIVAAAVQLPGSGVLGASAQKAKAGLSKKPPAAPGTQGVLAAPAPDSEPSATPEPLSPVPFLLPPVADDYDVDAAIGRAAQVAEQTARATSTAALERQSPDYRAMLPQGAVIEAPPLPLGGTPIAKAPATAASDGINSFVLTPTRPRSGNPPTPEQGKAAVAQQQFFAVLTARLKAANQRVLAEALKAGPKATVQMQFVVDREGRILDIRASDGSASRLVERAAATLRAAQLPPVPDVMTSVPVELSFPVEVYQ